MYPMVLPMAIRCSSTWLHWRPSENAPPPVTQGALPMTVAASHAFDNAGQLPQIPPAYGSWASSITLFPYPMICPIPAIDCSRDACHHRSHKPACPVWSGVATFDLGTLFSRNHFTAALPKANALQDANAQITRRYVNLRLHLPNQPLHLYISTPDGPLSTPSSCLEIVVLSLLLNETGNRHDWCHTSQFVDAFLKLRLTQTQETYRTPRAWPLSCHYFRAALYCPPAMPP